MTMHGIPDDVLIAQVHAWDKIAEIMPDDRREPLRQGRALLEGYEQRLQAALRTLETLVTARKPLLPSHRQRIEDETVETRNEIKRLRASATDLRADIRVLQWSQDARDRLIQETLITRQVGRAASKELNMRHGASIPESASVRQSSSSDR